MATSTKPQALIIGNQRIKIEEISAKIERDVSFLRHRIHRLENQTKPNTVIIKTYEDMLHSRLSVLNWLEDYAPVNDENCNFRMTS
ncbi:MAG: hypothetical protein CL693_07485 [Cellvibrionaceae bacterium]|nr:hypothetical protein [Cellvibrionaceae bacterium]|tara:strand:+ start:45933 stop:46190 length:258 start_codon:yes stop_codon:yes gene_type:complete